MSELPMGNSPGRGKKIAFATLAIGVSLGLLLSAAEIGLRLANIPFEANWTPSENAIARYDDTLGWAHQEGLSKEVQFETRTRAVHFDRNGARVPRDDWTLDPEAPSALFVGGSYTMGHGLSFEDSFVGRFGEAVASGAADRANTGPPGHLQVVNLGVQAYGTGQAFLALQRHLPNFNTRIVVYTFIESHLRRTANHDRRLLFPRGRFLGTKPTFELRDEELVLARTPSRYEDYRHSCLLDLVRMALAKRKRDRDEEAVRLTRAVVQEMAALCRDAGAYFVLMNWRWTEEDYDGFDDLGIPVIDTLDGAPRNWDKLRLPGDDHPNERASRRAAELLVQHLTAAGQL